MWVTNRGPGLHCSKCGDEIPLLERYLIIEAEGDASAMCCRCSDDECIEAALRAEKIESFMALKATEACIAAQVAIPVTE